MFFADSVSKNELYDLSDVFSRDLFFYKDSTIRITGWETPVSLIYRDGNEVKIRFKKEIEKYAEGFEDEPFDSHPMFSDSVFYDIMVEHYNEKQPIRCLNYAIKQYKKTHRDFAPVRLLPKELEEKLRTEELLQVAYPLESDRSLFNASCLWFPVETDAIITDFSNREIIPGNETAILFADGDMMFGHIGFDGKFYRRGMHTASGHYEVYTLQNGLKKTTTPEWLSESPYIGTGYQFFREYIVSPACDCYGYTGEFLADKTTHHRNVRWMNNLIRLLWKLRSDPDLHRSPYTRLMAPQNFEVFRIDDVERVVIPHLSSKNALNKKAYEQFLGIKKLIKKVGLQEDFELAFRNIVVLNKSTVYGGSRRNICGNRLLCNLQKLYKKLGAEKMATTLQNKAELKKEIARINGTTVVEYTVSALDYQMIKNECKLPKTIKQDAFWCSLEPDTLVIFSCDTTESFFAVVSNTKKHDLIQA